MKHKIECDLNSCKKKFAPNAVQQRFCCAKHRNRWHHEERVRLLRHARNMGIETWLGRHEKEVTYVD